MKHVKIQVPPVCPTCGLEVRWDTEHMPHAWRHVETISRWCTGAECAVWSLELHSWRDE